MHAEGLQPPCLAPRCSQGSPPAAVPLTVVPGHPWELPAARVTLKKNLLSFSLFLLFTPQTNRTVEINAGVGGGVRAVRRKPMCVRKGCQRWAAGLRGEHPAGAPLPSPRLAPILRLEAGSEAEPPPSIKRGVCFDSCWSRSQRGGAELPAAAAAPGLGEHPTACLPRTQSQRGPEPRGHSCFRSRKVPGEKI